MISYAGVNLMLDDTDGRTCDFLDRYLSVEDLRICSIAPALQNNSLPLPYPNYAAPLRPKINTLYFPTGASRWAFGYFLADTVALTAILDALDESADGSGALLLQDGFPQENVAWGGLLEEGSTALEFAASAYHADRGRAISLDMYCLTPRPIHEVGAANELFLLPLVDRRYFWQSVQLIPDCTSWATLLADIETALDEEFGTTTTTDHGTPDAELFAKRPNRSGGPYYNAAVLLDAACVTLGKRLNTLPVESAATAKLMGSSDWTSLRDVMLDNPTTAGANMPLFSARFRDGKGVTHTKGWVPETLRIVFPKVANDRIQDAAPWEEDRLATSYGFSEDQIRTGSIWYVNDSAGADFTTGGGTPDNNTNIDNLANAIATEFFGWLIYRADITFPGVHPWLPTGFDDYVEWSMMRMPDGSYQHQTRVHPLPYNFLPERLAHKLIDVEADGCEQANAIIDLFLAGNPTAGTVDFDFTINGTTETMTFDWDFTAAEVETEMETHSEIANGDVTVTGGPFPSANIRIEFTGDLANTDIAIPSPIDWSALTDAVYAWAAYAQRGFA